MTPQPPSQIHSFCPFSVQSSPQAVQYLSPDDAHTVLVGPICRSFYKQATCNKLLWRAMCGSEPWEIPYEHLDAMCLCSITAWSDLENKHSSEGASGGANCGFGTRRILPPFMRSSSSSSSSSFSWPHPHFAPLRGQHPRCPSSPHAASRPPRPSKWGIELSEDLYDVSDLNLIVAILAAYGHEECSRNSLQRQRRCRGSA